MLTHQSPFHLLLQVVVDLAQDTSIIIQPSLSARRVKTDAEASAFMASGVCGDPGEATRSMFRRFGDGPLTAASDVDTLNFEAVMAVQALGDLLSVVAHFGHVCKLIDDLGLMMVCLFF